MGATAFIHFKFGKKMEDKTPFYLMYVLTAFTCLWGVLTGTYFGQAWLPASVSPVIPWLNDFTNVQLLCFSIALVHLSIARGWAALAKFPSITFLSEVGWLLIVWGMFFVANMFVLGMAFPAFAKFFFILGIPLAFFFMVEPKDFLKSVGMEIVPFFLNVISAGTDLVSYIRLFAVGLATIAVADATNSMAGIVPPLATPVVLLFGHTLNLILALMAILVHAIRLNVLEFSGQLGLEWAGIGYNPFKKISKEK
ncbi:V-type ATP synthase subunit I [hydrothermal vent metagenome]|uniref:V-type ATP synthase subunit I n=1 Tax=hydrothermal vent metagenome TaxID=652676 RepID=A0A3B1D419_9ZZZZ